ncbi:hypothetical protein GNZ12_26795 [Paraburkholderia sp. 1N]|uniref:DUF3391 domain-containing protein n=1 Tax=Paraburkholderia solitsugae TaxID=2675748 RepID=A0ABX2BY56_9BURK|nr:hypothetical protein [Paraburkholderia solitsugae]NPT44860.1 hypothetical protein [Paraburkholderia solitsugae]
MNDNIRRFPRPTANRKRLDLNTGMVRCEVSSRWLQFPDTATAFTSGTLMCIDVMTLGEDDQPRKLCELVLSKEDLIAMLDRVPVKSTSE